VTAVSRHALGALEVRAKHRAATSDAKLKPHVFGTYTLGVDDQKADSTRLDYAALAF
jgi:hypothetical protein